MMECSFDHSDPGDGVIVSVLHTGKRVFQRSGDIFEVSGPSDAGELFVRF